MHHSRTLPQNDRFRHLFFGLSHISRNIVPSVTLTTIIGRDVKSGAGG
jgi:hypothetical protein